MDRVGDSQCSQNNLDGLLLLLLLLLPLECGDASGDSLQVGVNAGEECSLACRRWWSDFLAGVNGCSLEPPPFALDGFRSFLSAFESRKGCIMGMVVVMMKNE
jgi:hypothetical protein